MKFDLGEGWFKNGSEIIKAVSSQIDVSKPIKIIEIGSFKGRSTIWFIETLLKNPDSVIHCIDPWKLDDFESFNDDSKLQKKYQTKDPDEIYKQFMFNIEHKGYKNRCVLHRNRSGDVIDQFKNEEYDFIYVDGDHSYQGCYEDIVHYWPKLKKGGILFGDDWQYAGIRKAAYRFEKETGNRLHKRFYIPYILY